MATAAVSVGCPVCGQVFDLPIVTTGKWTEVGNTLEVELTADSTRLNEHVLGHGLRDVFW